jgi:hypothetical protein
VAPNKTKVPLPIINKGTKPIKIKALLQKRDEDLERFPPQPSARSFDKRRVIDVALRN